jgi:hypothetical protein
LNQDNLPHYHHSSLSTHILIPYQLIPLNRNLQLQRRASMRRPQTQPFHCKRTTLLNSTSSTPRSTELPHPLSSSCCFTFHLRPFVAGRLRHASLSGIWCVLCVVVLHSCLLSSLLAAFWGVSMMESVTGALVGQAGSMETAAVHSVGWQRFAANSTSEPRPPSNRLPGVSQTSSAAPASLNSRPPPQQQTFLPRC